MAKKITDEAALKAAIKQFKKEFVPIYASTPNILQGTGDGFLAPGDYIPTTEWAHCVKVPFDDGVELAVGDKIAVSIESIEQTAGSAPNGYTIGLWTMKGSTLVESIGTYFEFTKANREGVLTVNKQIGEGCTPYLLLYPAENGHLIGCQARYGRVMAIKGDIPVPWAPSASEAAGNASKTITSGKLSEGSGLMGGIHLVRYSAAITDYPTIFKDKFSTALMKVEKFTDGTVKYILQTIYPCSTDKAATGCMPLYRTLVIVQDTITQQSPWRTFAGTAYDEPGEAPGPIEIISETDSQPPAALLPYYPEGYQLQTINSQKS